MTLRLAGGRRRCWPSVGRRRRPGGGGRRRAAGADAVSYRLGMFPLSTVLFPGAGLPLHVFEERYRTLMARCLEADGEFGVVLIARGSEVGGGDLRVDVGTVARIANVAELDDGRMLVVATGVRRVRVEEWLPDDPYPRALVEDLPDDACSVQRRVLAAAEASLRRLRSLLSELGDVPALPTACGSPATPTRSAGSCATWRPSSRSTCSASWWPTTWRPGCGSWSTVRWP